MLSLIHICYRIPGRGELDWGRLLGKLQANGYTGTISLEHEDAAYELSLIHI